MGDIHGQLYDLKKIINLGGSPDKTKYLFLGDYVDRGDYGVEIMIALLVLKINFPNTIFLLRGNHESRQITTGYTFKRETLNKYDQEIYELLVEAFEAMPIGAIINGQFLAVHGGLSPHLVDCLDLNRLDRFVEIP